MQTEGGVSSSLPNNPSQVRVKSLQLRAIASKSSSGNRARLRGRSAAKRRIVLTCHSERSSLRAKGGGNGVEEPLTISSGESGAEHERTPSSAPPSPEEKVRGSSTPFPPACSPVRQPPRFPSAASARRELRKNDRLVRCAAARQIDRADERDSMTTILMRLPWTEDHWTWVSTVDAGHREHRLGACHGCGTNSCGVGTPIFGGLPKAALLWLMNTFILGRGSFSHHSWNGSSRWLCQKRSISTTSSSPFTR